MPIPQIRKLTAVATLAASAFEDALPNVSSTSFAVAPVRFRWSTRCCAKALVSPPGA